MKRDMELVRKILLATEAHDNPNVTFRIENVLTEEAEDQLMYHAKILVEAGMLNARVSSSAGSLYVTINGLTWQGHEFLDAIRDETVWNQTKEVVKGKGGSLPFEVIKALAVDFAKSMVGL